MAQNKYILIPQQKQRIIAKVEKTQIKEIGSIDIPWNKKTVITSNKLIVALDAEISHPFKNLQSNLTIFDFNGNILAKISANNYLCMNVKENVVYLGGVSIEHRKEKFALLDLNKKTWILQEIEIPDFLSEEKGIDEILIFENRLLLIDNVVIPKYIFEYDISEPSAPCFVRKEEITECYTWDSVIKGDINEKWIALLSSSFNRLGTFNHIRITQDLKEYFVFSSTVSSWTYLSRSSKVRFMEIKDIVLFHDYLLILSDKGLGVLDLTRINKRKKEISEKTIFWNKTITGDSLLKTDYFLIIVNKNFYKALSWEEVLPDK
jgi:hypothetical protein